MIAKRMRVVAGPNGSGKTTILKQIFGEVLLGVYVNADDIESMLRESKVLLFSTYQLNIKNEVVQNFFKASTFSPVKRKEPDLWKDISVTKNVLHVKCKVDSYLAAYLAEFIRQQLLMSDISFSYETVMSHQSKISFLQQAKENNYKVYLYYVATEDPEINITRVNVRVAQHGHTTPHS